MNTVLLLGVGVTKFCSVGRRYAFQFLRAWGSEPKIPVELKLEASKMWDRFDESLK